MELDKVNVEELKVRLKEAEVAFGNRSGVERLVELATEAGIEIPMLEEPRKNGNVVPEQYRKEYGKEQNCGDELARVFREFTTDSEGKCSLDKLDIVASQNGLDIARWSHLNIGMQRMSLGNVLRGRLKRGERVEVGQAVWEATETEAETSEEATEGTEEAA